MALGQGVDFTSEPTKNIQRLMEERVARTKENIVILNNHLELKNNKPGKFYIAIKNNNASCTDFTIDFELNTRAGFSSKTKEEVETNRVQLKTIPTQKRTIQKNEVLVLGVPVQIRVKETGMYIINPTIKCNGNEFYQRETQKLYVSLKV
jgi:hypothetical protein